MQFVNDQFFELTGHPRAPVDQFEWFNLIADDDVKKVETNWADMRKGKRSDGIQFRLKKTWVNQDGVRSNIWVQSSSHPQLDEQGNVISIVQPDYLRGIVMLTSLRASWARFSISVNSSGQKACRADESEKRWRRSDSKRSTKTSLLRRLFMALTMSSFIDMTSHELRNPLSAIVQCAESVIATLEHLPGRTPTATPNIPESGSFREDIDSSIDALHTIVSCSLHQKRIIDDVLTLSKLDSNLILITPVRVQPAVVVSEALKMFNVECHQMDIQLDLNLDETFKGFEWVMLDPSRLLQVLINLL